MHEPGVGYARLIQFKVLELRQILEMDEPDVSQPFAAHVEQLKPGKVPEMRRLASVPGAPCRLSQLSCAKAWVR